MEKQNEDSLQAPFPYIQSATDQPIQLSLWPAPPSKLGPHLQRFPALPEEPRATTEEKCEAEPLGMEVRTAAVRTVLVEKAAWSKQQERVRESDKERNASNSALSTADSATAAV